MTSPLLALSEQQWEDLCDGCGRCCLVKLEDEDTSEIYYTNVACEYLDRKTCRCKDYENREENNPACMVLDRTSFETLSIMPFTCAYRLAHERRSINQLANSLSVKGKVVSEEYIHEEQLMDHIVDWISVDRED
ncbi:MAG: YcgN family cysteine cluster protein [Acidiferrobacterales bacterium]|nr:YcgN family cysteine cluster protein [Acidiferrobacterales bacterium]